MTAKPMLYHCADARSLRCLWAVEETGFECDLSLLPFPPRFHAPDYKQVNQLGTVPAWIEGERMMTESVVICQRIALGTPLEILSSDPDYFDYLNWLHRSDATLTFPLAVMIRYTRVEQGKRRLAQAVEDYKGFFLGRAKSIETALADDREWLVANRFTIADICVGYALFLASTLGLGAELGEQCRAYLARLENRSGFKSARERQQGESV